MSAQMIPNTTKVLVNASTVTATGFSAAFTLPMADSYGLFMNVTAQASTTIDFVLQTSPDGGTTWLNLPLRFAQFTAAGQGYLRFQPTLGLGEAASGGTVAATGGVLALNTPFIGSQNTTALNTAQNIPTMRIGYTIGGAGSNTFTLYAIMAGRGNTTSN
jgi:hypothetical protein